MDEYPNRQTKKKANLGRQKEYTCIKLHGKCKLIYSHRKQRDATCEWHM